MKLENELEAILQASIKDASKEEIYLACLKLVKEYAAKKQQNEGDRKLYYISAEFLIGKLLSNNLINLGLYDDLAQILKENGHNLAEIEEVELEPSLGNGGLGRLAACFIDSMATLGLPADGVGLNYHFGLFKQEFENHFQHEVKNDWLTKDSWLNDTGISFDIELANKTYKSKLYDIDVIGYNNGVSKLHLFDIESVDETIVDKNSISFDKTDISKNLTLFLYPDDSDKNGELLRIYQQYFMVSNAAQLILKEEKDKGHKLSDLDKHVCIQINDTHPSMVIPELIRLLTAEGIAFNDAVSIVTNTTAYTNHTILAEALEKWPLAYLEKVVPQLVVIIKKLDKMVRAKYSNPELYIIDKTERVHMARMDMHYGFSINGVAAIHTEILKETELNDFYQIYPEKFNNKTNGITFRRWLMHCNHSLSNYIDEKIGEGWKKEATELEKLLKYQDDDEVLNKLAEIKFEDKKVLANYILNHEGISIDPNSIFDIQIKRLHEYKRQQMNALYIIHKYLEIKKGNLPNTPITCIFGAKAAPAYTTAKDIIHLLLCLADLINNDPSVNKYLKVVMVENYNVSYAEKLIPACNVSEQISLASKEASGTGNMKFMLNGAITLGTMDGANVEIAELVKDDNIFTFGEDSDTVIKHYENADYVSKDIYKKDKHIQTLVDFIISDQLTKIGDKERLTALYEEILNKDWFMTLLDLNAYIKEKELCFKAYENQKNWNKMALVNIAKAGYFSSDRTIEQYNNEIWKLK